jgi:hypothetical protein
MESSRKAQERLPVFGQQSDWKNQFAGLLVKQLVQTERELEQC